MIQKCSKYYLIVIITLINYQVLAQNAVIESITPKSGYAGQVVNIQGSGFTGADRVFFGAMEGEVISVTDQLIEAKAPSGATYDNIMVLNSTTRLYFSSEHFMLSYGGEQGVTADNFEDQLDIFSGSGLYDVSIVDIDGDGKNDIIGSNSKTTIATFLRNLSTPGSISFVKTNLNLGATGLNSTAGDLNGDGKPEIILSEGNDGNRLLILVNNSTPGNFSFTFLPVTISGSSTKRVVIKDLDLDGKPDLVVSDQTNNQISIVRNTTSGGTLSFDSNIININVSNAESTAGLDVEDLNGDGKPEIVTNQFLTDGGGFYIATNQSSPGNISFGNFQQFNSQGTFVNLKVGDINGDNRPDVVATLFLSSAVGVFLNQSSGSGGAVQFGTVQNVNTAVRPWGLDFGDIDGDNNVDIVVSTIGDNKAVNVLNNVGSGGVNFSTVSIPVTYINRNIKAADIDGDSKPDLIFSSVDDESNNIISSNISILRNTNCITPVISPEGPLNVCVGNPVTLETQSLQGVTYEWRQDGTVVQSGADNFIEITDPTQSGSYTVSIISDGGSCAEESEPVEVTITAAGALPSASISSDSPICLGATLNLSSSDVGATKYEWSGPDGFSAEGINVQVTNFNAAKAGKYTLDVYSGTCIIETVETVVDIVSSPNFTVQQSGDGAYCEGENVSLSVSPNDANYSYQWLQNGNPIAGETAATFSPTATGNYSVEITDQVNNTCPPFTSENLSVTILAQPQASFSFPSNSCGGAEVSFTNDSQVADESLATYSWNFGDGGSSTDKNPSHTYNTPGNYNVTLSISYDGFTTCSDELTQQIIINGASNVSISSSATAICDGDSVVLSVDNNLSNIEWSNGSTSNSITVSEAGTYSVTVTDPSGCEGFGEITVESFPPPVVELTASSILINEGDTLIVGTSNLTEYTWFADSVAVGITNQDLEIVLFANTIIRVEGRDENGCFGSAEIEITVEETNIGDFITADKFFSPNNDGIADLWEIENIQNFSQCGVEIYDQQGNKLFEAKPYNNDWNGLYNGSPIPDGVYYFVVRCDDDGIVKSGTITLLR